MLDEREGGTEGEEGERNRAEKEEERRQERRECGGRTEKGDRMG